MLGFIITGHASFAPGLASAITMVAGEQPEFEVLPFEDVHAADFGRALIESLRAMAARTSGVVVFCDLLGGTPFNQAMIASEGMSGVRVAAGVNLPMLLELLFMRNANDGLTADGLAGTAVEVGRASIVSKRLGEDAASACEGSAAQGPSADTVADPFDGEGI